eukprot:gene6802-10968_t
MTETHKEPEKHKVKVIESKGKQRELDSNIHWKMNKNIETLEKNKSPNVLFYDNKMASIPHGDTIENILKWKGDYHTLEFHHGYVQWLFPNSEGQGQNLYSSPLTKAEADAISSDLTMKKRLIRAFEMMLDFFGMELKDEGLGLFERKNNWQERYHSLKTTPHNFLRISRIIKSLVELGQTKLASGFVNFLVKEILENGQLENGIQSLISFWIPSLPISDKKLVEEYIKEKDLINLFIQKHKNKPEPKSEPKQQTKPQTNEIPKPQQSSFQPQQKPQQNPFKRQVLEKKQPQMFEIPKPQTDKQLVQPEKKVEMEDLYDEEITTPSKVPNFTDLFQTALKQKHDRSIDVAKLEELQKQLFRQQSQITKPKVQQQQSPRSQSLQQYKKQRLEQISETPFVITFIIGEEKQPVEFFNFPDNISPHGWRVHLALEELQIPYKTKFLNPMNLDHRSTQYLKINERGEIPTIIDQGIVVSESMAIIQYLNETYGEGKLMPKDKKSKAIALTRMSQYLSNLDPIFSEIVLKGRLLKLPKKDIKNDIEDLFHELSYWDFYAEKSLWLAGEFSLADILLYPVIAECVHMGLDVDLKYPHLGRWFRNFKKRSSSKETWPEWMGGQLLLD